MKIAFAATIDDNSIPGFLVALYSLIKTHGEFTYPIYVFEWGTLSLKSKETILKVYKNIIFKDIKVSDYSKNEYDAEFRTWTYNCAYRFEIFEIVGYDKIVFFDSDIIFQTPFLNLITPGIEFGVIERCFVSQTPDNKGFNAGLMIIDKKYLSTETKYKLLEIYNKEAPADIYITSHKWAGNEPILNYFFLDKNITWLPKYINVCTDEIDSSIDINKCNLHYIGNNKPWQSTVLAKQFDTHIDKALTLRNGKFMSSVIMRKLSTKFKRIYKECLTCIENS